MKKIIKNPIFTFILGALIFGGIVGVSAYTIFANDIGYTPKDSSWEVDNVKDAIDDLYTKKNGGLYEEILFMIPSQNGSGYDMTALNYDGNIYYYDIPADGINTKGLKYIGWTQDSSDSSTYYAKENGYYMYKAGYGATANGTYYDAGSVIISGIKHRSKGCIIAKLKKEITTVYREP
jgi:hypothetical protein